jgi:hypothetical protein
MKIEFEIPDAIAEDAISEYAKALRHLEAFKKPGVITEPLSDMEFIKKHFSDQFLNVYKRLAQAKILKSIDDKINGNNISG